MRRARPKLCQFLIRQIQGHKGYAHVTLVRRGFDLLRHPYKGYAGVTLIVGFGVGVGGGGTGGLSLGPSPPFVFMLLFMFEFPTPLLLAFEFPLPLEFCPGRKCRREPPSAAPEMAWPAGLTVMLALRATNE